MKRLLGAALATLFTVVVGSCGQAGPTSETAELLAAVGGTNRPFKGVCSVTLAARVHDDEEEEGGCGGCGGRGGGEEEEGGGCGEDQGGGPPIPRHYNVTGSCALTHLGLVGVTGRMNLTGPFGAHEGHLEPTAHGQLAVRGRLGFEAANGDLVGGSYIPVEAAFTAGIGRVVFTSVQTIGASCSDLGGGGGGEGHDEPVLTGRFAGATGQVTLTGDVLVSSLTRTGSGTIRLSGLISY